MRYRIIWGLIFAGTLTVIPLAGCLNTSESASGTTVKSKTTGEGAATPESPSTVMAELPFKLEIEEVPNSALPALHSFCLGNSDGKWLVFGGRKAGLHGFGPTKNNFPRDTANTVAYVIDPAANKVLGSVDLVKSLPAGIAGPLTSTNQEFVQVGKLLYAIGGYGQSLTTGKNSTMGSLIQIDVPGIIGAITSGSSIGTFVKQNPELDNRLKVSGGVLKWNANTFYLVFGQDFSGDYSIQNSDYNHAGGQFQKYTEKIRVFTLNPDLSINTFNQVDGGYDPNLPYHRRDLNVVDTVSSGVVGGVVLGAEAYGGVFLAGQVGGHTSPIEINFSPKISGVTAKVVTGFKQALNHYDCADLTLYDRRSGSCFTTLFGGISQYHYDIATNKLIQDTVNLSPPVVDGLPFIDTISTIERVQSGVYKQYIEPVRMPALLGTDGEFLLDPSTAAFPNGVINLGALVGRKMVGYVYGGIESPAPYSSFSTTNPPTSPSARLFKIYVTATKSNAIPMPPLPTTTTPVHT